MRPLLSLMKDVFQIQFSGTFSQTETKQTKDKTPKHKLSGLVNTVQHSEEWSDIYTGEAKQQLHRWANSGQDSEVYLYLKDKEHSFKDNNVHISDREDRWFERSERRHLCET